MKNKLTPLERKWVLYDVGNSAFALLTASILPIYFNHLSSMASVSEENYLAAWSYAAAISTVLVGLLGPVFGTLADFKNRKKRMFIISLILGVLSLFSFWLTQNWLVFLILFVLCKVFFSISLVIYDSMLVDVAPQDDLDMVSSKGYAYGYIGSVIPFVISLVFILFYEQIGISFTTAMALTFTINAGWWFVCSLPLVKSYRQKHFAPRQSHAIVDAFKRLGKTFSNIRKEKKIFLFMLAFFFYIDGVYTVMEMATAYGTSLGLDQSGLLLALLVTQIVAFPASIIVGMMAKKHSTAALIKVGILGYLGISIFALFMATLWQFWILAILVGCFQGGIQALSRSYFAKIIPEDASGEYFGLFDIAGKGASFLGTLLVGLITQITGQQNLAVGCLSVLFIIGFLIFNKVSKLPDPEEA